MPRLASRRSIRAAALAVAGTVLTVCSSGVAGAAPPTPSLPAAIEPLASYVPQSTCDPTAKPGATALRSLVMAAYPNSGDYGIVLQCSAAGVSEHKEGRAWDWKVNAADPAQDAEARDLFAWLFAPDAQGNRYAMARRLGIMYMIYNHAIWGSYNADAGWRPYTGDNPHTDHVHISLSWPGANRTTSYWTGAVSHDTTGSVPAPAAPPPSDPSAVDAAAAATTEVWSQLGGDSGTLGKALGSAYDVRGGRAQDFERGRVYWSLATGAVPVYGAIGARYLALGGPDGPLGMPTAAETDVRGGRMSAFSGGRVYWSASTGAKALWGSVVARYLATGGPDGPLGLPVQEETAVPGGVSAGFSGGQIYWSGAHGAVALWGAIGQKYLALGGPGGTLGMPTAGEAAVNGGRGASFERGRVYFAGGATTAVWGAIAAEFVKLGAVDGPLGLPTAEEHPVRGGVETSFTGGRVLWSATTGAHGLWGGIGGEYTRAGGPDGPLGLPSSDEADVPGGRGTSFQYGQVYWSPTLGAHAVWGAISARFLQFGGPKAVGLPLADEQDAGTGRVTRFTAGNIYWSPDSGARFIYGAVLGRYATADPRVVGLPTAEESAAGGGRAVPLQHGLVVWSAPTGARLVTGPVLERYLADGGPAGALGLPTGELDQLTPTVARQAFTAGQVFLTPTGPHLVIGAILGQYLALGGPTGRLGAPTSEEFDVPGGRRTSFAGGWITWDAATGSVTVSGTA